jgi:phosphatidylinositol 4-kinase type 2
MYIPLDLKASTDPLLADFLMRNTDRGLDNFMIRYCDAEHESTLVDVEPSKLSQSSMPQMSELRRDPLAPLNSSPGSPDPSRPSTTQPPYARKPHMHIAAIDNSLSFPHEHPKGWRSYTYGVSGVLL